MSSPAKNQILLLQPWIEDFYATDCRSLPLGLAYLAGSIKKSLRQYSIFLYDFFSPYHRRTISIPKEFGYLEPYYGVVEKSPSALFHHYFRFGASDDEIKKTLKPHSPFLIGISSLFSPYYRQSLALAALCKTVFPATPIVMGGNHASLSPETLLFHQNDRALSGFSCDYVIRGEGEESIIALIEALAAGWPPDALINIVGRSNHATATSIKLHQPDRQQIPFPDYCNLDLTRYTFKKKPMGFLLTSRSCPHQCSFCSIHAVFGRRHTTRPADDITAEIEHFHARGIRHFDIEDDNFSFHQEKCEELLDRIISLDLADISFSAMNGVSYHTLTPRLIKKMKRAGFADLNLSLVSSQEHLQKKSHRPSHGEELDTVLHEAHLSGFHSVVYFIIGLPGQSLEEAVETLCHLAGKKCLIGPSPFYMTPNSPLHREYQGLNTLSLASAGKDPWFSARLTALDVESKGFSRDEIYTVFRLTRVINSLKGQIDDGLTPAQEPMADAIATLAKGEWQSRIQKGSPPPFAPSVLPYLKRYLTTICGYKTPHTYQLFI